MAFYVMIAAICLQFCHFAKLMLNSVRIENFYKEKELLGNIKIISHKKRLGLIALQFVINIWNVK